jgi:hypothetical protein
MKDFVKKLLLINLLMIGIAGTLLFILAENSCCGLESENAPYFFMMVVTASIIYSIVFVLIDLINPSKIKYFLIHTFLYTVFLIIFPLWEFPDLLHDILGDYGFFFLPIPFLLIHLICVLYKKFN